MSDNFDKLEGRLRAVETDVATIRERLTHMPTTAEMQKMLNGVQAKVLIALGTAMAGAVLKWAWPVLFPGS